MSRKSNALASAKAKTAMPDRRIVVHEPAALLSEKVGNIMVPVRQRLARTPSRNWKQNLEKNLIKEGFTPAKARELVEIAAS